MPESVLNIQHARGQSRILELTPQEIAEQVADCFVITDSNLARHHGHLISGARHVITVPAGEQSKTWAQAGEVVEQLAEAGATRKSTVVAFGGGVVGDLGGFAAAAYMRGINLIQAPTSLLAMVDSAVGGKVGVDLRAGKNLAGSFWPGQEVWLCYPVLQTLPAEEWRNGSAEIWKYGAIDDAGLFRDLLEEPIHPGRAEMDAIIRLCVRIKANIVQADEHETKGLRALLNFGHTLGHAVEAEMNYTGISHGEAVAIGMVWEAGLAEKIGFALPGVANKIESAMSLQGLPVEIPEQIDRLNLLKWMKRDKKADRDRLAFSLVEEIGRCKLYESVPEADVRALLTER